MSSRLAALPRRVPQQQRGERRVAALLKAAASVISDAGYDSATMCEIAERAGACIGSLYQFFPNKEAVAHALRMQYRQEVGSLWASLEESESLSIEDVASQLVVEMIAFLEDRPALRQLLNFPVTPHDKSIRDVLRRRLARILRSCAPSISGSQAHLYASISLQLMKAMNELYGETVSKTARKTLVHEYECVLGCYLQAQLGSAGTGARRLARKN
ncbi:MAG TPA: helix-turn-helix domain-containing protein [Bryobacteraceae bacterium]|nr:helix-turn-helix domain-containing protein [Bryobacteraceae bacterium]